VIAAVVAALRDLLDAGIPVVAYNAPFDFSLLKYEALRHGIPPILEPSPVIDPLVLDKAHDRFRRASAPSRPSRRTTPCRSSAPTMRPPTPSRPAASRRRWHDDSTRRPAPRAAHPSDRWARAQADSLTEYFIRIGRLDPDDRLDGSWPIR
jgi:DNA polymerase-3 subunit epsilon